MTHTTTFTAPNIPERLLTLTDPPKVLYVKGDRELLTSKKTLGIVGSRKMSRYGERVLRCFVPACVTHDITIISGLAFGVDITAHKLTLEHGGKAVAVLGSGIENITPRTHHKEGKLIEKSGALVSEYPGATEAHKHFFPARNRIIAGLSDVLLVIEGTARSGSLITADFMLQLGRDVLAVPGPIDAPLSQGTNMLIANGAQLAQSPDDILFTFGIDNKQPAVVSSDVSSDEKQILSILSENQKTFDEICQLCTLLPSTVNGSLTTLELKGLISTDSQGRYIKT